MSEDLLFDEHQPDDLADIKLPHRATKKKRKAFKADWVKFTRQWRDVLLRARSKATYQLAILILFKAFECKHTGREIILSAEMTGMPKTTRIRATKELVKLGLIKLHRQSSNQAYRVYLLRTR